MEQWKIANTDSGREKVNKCRQVNDRNNTRFVQKQEECRKNTLQKIERDHNINKVKQYNIKKCKSS